MQFKENAEVVTAEGNKVGHVDRLVIDPRSKALTHLVVKKGFLFTRDKVIPLNLVETAAEDRITLKKGPQDPDDFPDFEETHYVQVEETAPPERVDTKGLRPLAWYYPLPGGAWWHTRMGAYPGYPEPPYVRRTELNIPEGTIPLDEGAKVLSSDGKHVGDIERVYVDDQEQRVTHLLISKGLISKSHKLIPSMWVERVGDEEVQLSVGEHFIEKLP